jgi:hypothetical protein
MKIRLSLLLLALALTVVAAPEVFGANPKGGALGSGANGGARGDVMDCTWYSITCSNGTTDSCCGDVNSCLSYCATVCGGTCIYVDNAS